MVDFRPFRGFLPSLNKNDAIIDRVSPPYDIIGPEELAKLQSKPYNITKITLGGVDGKYDKAANLLDSWIASSKLVQDQEECYYLYRQGFQDNGRWLQRNGIVGILKAESYEAGNIIPHEETFPKVKEDRLSLLRSTATHCESIFGLYDHTDIDLEAIARQSQKLYECTDTLGTKHQFYRIADRAAVNAIRHMLADKKILIADGHHRYETSYKYAQENMLDERKSYVLCTLVSTEDSGMFVRPTHRLIKNLKVQEKELVDAMSKHLTLREVKDLASLTAALNAANKPTFGLWLSSGKLMVAEFTAPAGDILWSIDTYVCQEVLLKTVLYAFPKGNELIIDYDHDLQSIQARMKAGELDLAILVRPPTLQTVWEVARTGRKMPKKTTYFWPKIWSGFVLYRMQ